eukprot:TRINITY_DN124061_c0_g1_i1.p1 TRINITY_DN124061_c0_g1~~TRINITY_DN124061_c0_g1_i1.p1  ORF type:complete len:502 (+),score=196.69 TRINITY_DN124061_c0_g1_i1:83-1588(+)
MMKGNLFKMVTPKEIAQVLNAVGMHAAAASQIEQPTPEATAAMFQALSEFSYDMDVPSVKAQAQMPGLQHAEIYDEAMDVLIIFKLSRQLAFVNGLDDFSWKDVWEPSAKRLRAVLSGFVNFCRYKEAQTFMITSLKEDVQALDTQRLDLVDKCDQVQQELGAANAQHQEELPSMWAAETEVQNSRSSLERLQKQRQGADRVLEDEESKLKAKKEKISERSDLLRQLQEQRADLQGQIAESPKGLEQEIEELQVCLRQKKAFVEERGDEKRARTQRDQALARVNNHLQGYVEVLDVGAQLGEKVSGAADAAKKAREELAALQKASEAKLSEEAELEERVRQIQLETERANEVHDARIGEFEARRQAALQQNQAIVEKRTEEQKRYHSLQAEREKLEGEIAAERRAHEAEMAELLSQERKIFEAAEVYADGMESLLQSYGGAEVLPSRTEVVFPPRSRAPQATDYRIACSPSPAKSLRSPAADRHPARSPVSDRWLCRSPVR